MTTSSGRPSFVLLFCFSFHVMSSHFYSERQNEEGGGDAAET